MSAQQAARQARKPALVSIKGLSKSYSQRSSFFHQRKAVPVLQDIHLELLPECITALVGQSGCGKSTLVRCLSAFDKPDAGEIWFDGQEISQLAVRDLAPIRPQIQLIFQDSAGALNPRMAAHEIIAEPLEIQGGIPAEEVRSRACAAMEDAGLSADLRQRHPLELSGGQRQRLAIARALVLKPKLLILDESLSGLDLITQAQILDLLLDLRQNHGLTYLMISHDLSLVAEVADFVAVMQGGRIVEQGARSEVFSHPRHEQTQAFLASARLLEAGFRAMRAGLR